MLPKTVAVIGAGETGAGLAALISLAGCQVVLVDVREDFLRAAMKRVNAELGRLLLAEVIATEKKVEAIDRIVTSDSYAAAARADLLFECLPENEAKKTNAFVELDRVCSPATIFCTRASTLSFERLAASVSNPARFAGAHFSTPVTSARLVEVTRCSKTADRTLESLKEFLWFLGKVPVVLNESPGLVSKRVFFVLLAQACRMVEAGAASPADIDLALRLSAGVSRGPLALADAYGLDYCLEAMQALRKALDEPALEPPALLVEKVRVNALGVKTGRGFFEYK